MVLVGLGNASGGDAALDGMVGPDGNDAAWVQDPNLEIWEEFLGSSSAPRRQLVLLDKDLNKRYQFQYASSGITSAQETELLAAINELISELELLGDVNGDANLNIQDVILLVSMALGSLESDLIGDLNQDGGVNILDVVLLVNIIVGS
jgi:hypothetical protein